METKRNPVLRRVDKRSASTIFRANTLPILRAILDEHLEDFTAFTRSLIQT
ncbi:MAG TPA: hypothetical protein VF271_02670 [Rhodanobacteraceae bacterium]